MAATFSFGESNGAGEVKADLGSAGTLWAYKSADTSGTTDYVTNPITRGNNSYEKYIYGKFTGTFNQIQNIKFWGASTVPQAGVTMFAVSTQAAGYATPATSTVKTGANQMPQAGNQLSVGPTLSASGYSNYVIAQMRTDATSVVGDVATAGLQATISYDEN